MYTLVFVLTVSACQLNHSGEVYLPYLRQQPHSGSSHIGTAFSVSGLLGPHGLYAY